MQKIKRKITAAVNGLRARIYKGRITFYIGHKASGLIRYQVQLVDGSAGKFRHGQPVRIRLKPCISGSTVARWSLVNFTQIVLHNLTTAVSYVHKTWNDIGCFNNEVGRLKFSVIK
jgi:hypothetical protein